jgi:DNA-binding HxlR family transcriptional regulator
MTPHGRSLKPVIEALADWGRLHLKQQAARKTVIDRA